MPLSDLSQVSRKVREQATSFDEADFTIKYQDVPISVAIFARYSGEYLKSFLWPYLVINDKSSSSGNSDMGSTSSVHHWRFRYSEMTNTVDITLSKPEEKVVFKDVRVPRFVSYVLPYNAIK